MGFCIIVLISEICIIALINGNLYNCINWYLYNCFNKKLYKIIVLIKEGYKRIFINPTGAEKQKFLYKKSGVFTLQLLFNFIHF